MHAKLKAKELFKKNKPPLKKPNPKHNPEILMGWHERCQMTCTARASGICKVEKQGYVFSYSALIHKFLEILQVSTIAFLSFYLPFSLLTSQDECPASKVVSSGSKKAFC